MNRTAVGPAALWRRLSAGRRLLVPGVGEKGASRFVPGDWGAEPVILGAGSTSFSVKEHFFPQTDRLYMYDLGRFVTLREAAPATGETVVWGLRPCDAQALAVLDRVLADPEAPYENYVRRRETSLTVAFGCAEECEGGFCERLGVDRLVGLGADLAFIPAEDDWRLEALTAKGAAAAGLAEVTRRQPKPAPVPDFVGAGEIFDHPIWEALAETCLSCRACTFVCPTCHCFAVADEHLRSEGHRVAVWDSCAAPGFTKMAGGHNPRQGVTARVRQRILHKFAYFPERYGVTACTGCGRCAKVCPMGRKIEAQLDRVLEVFSHGG